MNKALIIIDAQEDFTRGALRNENAIKALSTLHEVASFAEENEFKLICYTRDTHSKVTYKFTQEGKNLPIEHCIINTPGHRICEEASIHNAALIIDKNTFGYKDWQRYSLKLHRVNEIWLCGFCTDICVSANFQILKATYPEVPIVVIKDACAGVTLDLHKAALKVMKSCQARIVDWKTLLKEQTNKGE